MPSLSMSIIVVTYFKKIDPNIKRKYFSLGLTSCVILLLIIHFTTNFHFISMIFPTDDIGTKWVGFDLHNFPLMLVGIGYYFLKSQMQ